MCRFLHELLISNTNCRNLKLLFFFFSFFLGLVFVLWFSYALIIILQVAYLLLLALSNIIEINGSRDVGHCKFSTVLVPRPHSVSILEFGAVGDGRTLNTIAFQNAIFYLKSFADKGGAQLYVPVGKWLTGSFNLTSHLTLFLEGGATILGTQVFILFLFVFPFFHIYSL